MGSRPTCTSAQPAGAQKTEPYRAGRFNLSHRRKIRALRLQEGDDALEGAVCRFSPGQLQGQGEWRVEGAEDDPLRARVFGDRSKRRRYALACCDATHDGYGSGVVRFSDDQAR